MKPLRVAIHCCPGGGRQDFTFSADRGSLGAAKVGANKLGIGVAGAWGEADQWCAVSCC